MRVFWLFVCIQVGIFALACLSDLIWKKKMKASAQRLGVESGLSPTEFSGGDFRLLDSPVSRLLDFLQCPSTEDGNL